MFAIKLEPQGNEYFLKFIFYLNFKSFNIHDNFTQTHKIHHKISYSITFRCWLFVFNSFHLHFERSACLMSVESGFVLFKWRRKLWSILKFSQWLPIYLFILDFSLLRCSVFVGLKKVCFIECIKRLITQRTDWPSP